MRQASVPAILDDLAERFHGRAHLVLAFIWLPSAWDPGEAG